MLVCCEFLKSLDTLVIEMSQVSKRNEIRTLWTSKIYKPKQISRALDVSLATVYRVIRRISEQQSLDHLRGAGRPAIVYQAIKKSVVKQIEMIQRSPFAKLPCSASKTSVHRCLKKLDYSKPFPKKVPMLSETNRIKRLDWARTSIDRLWNQAIFADEASFWLFGGSVRMWTKNSEFRVAPTVSIVQRSIFGPDFLQWGHSHSVFSNTI